MPASCAVSYRCAKHPRRQTGAALILAILTVALVATLAATVMADYGAAVASVSGRHEQAQARLLARGTVDWARNVLAEDKLHGKPIDYAGEVWAIRVPPLPIEDGEVSGEIQDLSGRFDLNRLFSNGVANPDQVAAYERLLMLLGVPDARARDLTAELLGWLSADNAGEADWYAGQTPPRRPAKALLVDVDELALVRGYDPALIAQLRPFVVALPQPAGLNVNTASAEVLAAVLPKLGLDSARMIVAQQQSTPFKDLADFRARVTNGSNDISNATISVSSRYFLASVRGSFGEATTSMQVMLDRRNTWPEIIWQKIL
jgi:general secretion pathway protein K